MMPCDCAKCRAGIPHYIQNQKYTWVVVTIPCLLIACGAAQNSATSAGIKLSAEECQSRALDIISNGKNCLETEQAINNLATTSPECVAVLGGGDFGRDYCHDEVKGTLERKLPQ